MSQSVMDLLAFWLQNGAGLGFKVNIQYQRQGIGIACSRMSGGGQGS